MGFFVVIHFIGAAINLLRDLFERTRRNEHKSRESRKAERPSRLGRISF